MTEQAPEPELRSCPHCGESAPPAASWCEACGSDLQVTATEARPAMPCVSCGAASASISGDGWCEQCGQRQPLPRDHYVRDHEVVAGASDKGRVHHRNEDALAIGVADGASIIVICDGVSSTDRPDEASQAAADAAAAVLGGVTEPSADVDLLGQATAAAQQAVIEVSVDAGGTDPPSCTFVGAIVRTGDSTVDVTIGWIGDSRAYWIDRWNPSASSLLTTDHSWSEAQRGLGELSEDAIAADPRAHSITRWIGVDAEDVTPETRQFSFGRGSGQLVVCSDGLWNYAASGGHDNISVALTHIAPSDIAAPSELGSSPESASVPDGSP